MTRRPVDPAVYDPDLALARAGGRVDLRDRALLGLLDWLDDPARGGLLLEVLRYGPEAAACYEVAHRAIGVAQQAATPQLEAQLRALERAFAAGDRAQAERLGRDLPVIVAAVCAALAGSSGPDGWMG